MIAESSILPIIISILFNFKTQIVCNPFFNVSSNIHGKIQSQEKSFIWKLPNLYNSV
jgi:hypothetical protein